MPARFVQDARCISNLERSVLPFLAPAILQPFPTFRFRRTSHSQTAVQSDPSLEAFQFDLNNHGSKDERRFSDQALFLKHSKAKQVEQENPSIRSSVQTISLKQSAKRIPALSEIDSRSQPAKNLIDLTTRPSSISQKSQDSQGFVSILSNSADQKWGYQCLAWTRAYRWLASKPKAMSKGDDPYFDVNNVISDGATVSQLKRSLLKGLSPAEAWNKLDDDSRRRIWQPLMLWTLRNATHQTFKLIRSTFQEPFPWAQAVADSFDYSVNYALGKKSLYKEPGPFVEDALSTLDCILYQHTGSVFPLQQRTVFFLVKNSTPEQITRLYNLLISKFIHLHENTVLQFLSTSIRHGNIKLSTSLIDHLVELGADLKCKKVLKACTSFFQRFLREEGNKSVGTRVLSLLMSHGFKPNIHIYNVLIKSACESQQRSEIEKLISLMKRQGIRPDAFTHSIILNNAKSKGDQLIFQQTLASFQKSGLPQDNPFIITDMLHSMFLSARSDPLAIGSFDRMLKKFRSSWSTQALEDLGVLLSDTARNDGEDTLSPEAKPDPPVPALSIMLSAFLESCHDNDKIEKIYHRYRELVESGQTTVAQLAKTDFIPNAFLNRFRRGQMDLDLCISVPETMMKQLPVRFDSNTTVQAPPTVQTWSILIATLLDRGLITAVEKVMGILDYHGLVPSKATWNTMISGLVRLQRVEDVAEVVQRMRNAGHELDHENLQRLKRIRDREGLLRALADVDCNKDMVRWKEQLETINPNEERPVDQKPALRPPEIRQFSSTRPLLRVRFIRS